MWLSLWAWAHKLHFYACWELLIGSLCSGKSITIYLQLHLLWDSDNILATYICFGKKSILDDSLAQEKKCSRRHSTAREYTTGVTRALWQDARPFFWCDVLQARVLYCDRGGFDVRHVSSSPAIHARGSLTSCPPHGRGMRFPPTSRALALWWPSLPYRLFNTPRHGRTPTISRRPCSRRP